MVVQVIYIGDSEVILIFIIFYYINATELLFVIKTKAEIVNSEFAKVAQKKMILILFSKMMLSEKCTNLHTNNQKTEYE